MLNKIDIQFPLIFPYVQKDVAKQTKKQIDFLFFIGIAAIFHAYLFLYTILLSLPLPLYDGGLTIMSLSSLGSVIFSFITGIGYTHYMPLSGCWGCSVEYRTNCETGTYLVELRVHFTLKDWLCYSFYSW